MASSKCFGHEMLPWTSTEELALSRCYSSAPFRVLWVLAKGQNIAFLKHNCEYRCLILPDIREIIGFQKKQSKL